MRTTIVLFLAFSAAAATAQTNVFTWTGGAPNANFGSALAAPGDLNGDGIPDVVIGSADTATGPVLGSVMARSGFDGSVLWEVFGGTSEGFGAGLATAGDVDSDGIKDVIVAAPGLQGTVGYTRILSGATGATIRSLPDPSDTVDGGGDYNGDGVPDQLACYLVPGSQNFLGGVKVYSGVDGAVLLDVTQGMYGLGGNGSATMRAKFLRDNDGDGYDDVIVSRLISGIAVLVRGPNGDAGGAVNSGATPPLWGVSVNDVGSVTGDSLNDVGVEWFLFASPVNAWFRVYNAATGAIVWQIQTLPMNPALPGAYTTRDTARLPDLDGDGKPEIVFGGGIPPGASVLSGATGVPLLTITAPFPPVGVGGTVVTLGDITGDGIPEFAYSYGNAPNGGQVFVASPVPLGLAAVTDLGGACGAYMTMLTATPPVLGTMATIAVSGGAPSASAALVADFAPDFATPYGSCVIHLDLAHAADWLQVPLALDGNGAATINLSVPSVPSLAQHLAAMQVVVLGTGSPLGFDLSNGLRATLGF